MEADESTKTLVLRANDGDREAFGLLDGRYRPRIKRYVESSMGMNVRIRLGVDDVVQETFARALHSIDNFEWRGKSSFYSWLRTIAEHVICEAARRKRQAKLVGDFPGGDPTPSQNMRRDERFERLKRAIRSLDKDQRTALLLARIDGLKVREIAARMNRAPGTVYKLLARAILQLKSELGDTQSLHLPRRSLGITSATDSRGVSVGLGEKASDPEGRSA